MILNWILPPNPKPHGMTYVITWGKNIIFFLWPHGRATWIRTSPCLKLTLPLRPSMIQTEVTFQLYGTWSRFVPDRIIRCLLYDHLLWPWVYRYIPVCLFVTHINFGVIFSLKVNFKQAETNTDQSKFAFHFVSADSGSSCSIHEVCNHMHELQRKKQSCVISKVTSPFSWEK